MAPYGVGSIFPASTHVLEQGVRSFHGAPTDSPAAAGETQGLVTPHACDMTGCGSGSVRCHGIESVPSRACGDLGSVRSQQFGWVRMLPDPKSES